MEALGGSSRYTPLRAFGISTATYKCRDCDVRLAKDDGGKDFEFRGTYSTGDAFMLTVHAPSWRCGSCHRHYIPDPRDHPDWYEQISQTLLAAITNGFIGR